MPFPSWEALINVVSAALVLSYAVAPVSVAALRRNAPDMPRPFRVKGFAVLGPVSFIIAALIVYWSGWATVSWLLGLQILMFGIYLLCRRLVPTDHLHCPAGPLFRLADRLSRSPSCCPWLGSFGGIGLISHPFDTLVVAVCALAVYGARPRACPAAWCAWKATRRKAKRAGRDPSSGGCRSRGFRVLSGAGRGWNDETSTSDRFHTGGEPTRLIIDGFPVLAGGTMAEKRDVLREQYDQRRACLLEPRGNDVLVGALCCEPVSQDAVRRDLLQQRRLSGHVRPRHDRSGGVVAAPGQDRAGRAPDRHAGRAGQRDAA